MFSSQLKASSPFSFKERHRQRHQHISQTVVFSVDSVFVAGSAVAGAGGDVNHAIGLYDEKDPGAATDGTAAGLDSKGSSTPVPLVATFAAAVAAA